MISKVSDAKVTIMQFDDNSERFTFTIPRMIEGHDMYMSDDIEIHFTNTGTGTSVSTRAINSDIYRVKDKHITEEEPDILQFSWLVGEESTQLAGSLTFLVKFICYAEPGYKWHTHPCTFINVAAGMNNSGRVAEIHSDIIAEIERRMDEMANNEEINNRFEDIERRMTEMPNDAEIDARFDEIESRIAGMLNTDIFPRSTVDFTQEGDMYLYNVPSDKNFTLIAGNVYYVEWNGKIFTCIAQTHDEAGGMVYIGNPDIVSSNASVMSIAEERLATPSIYLDSGSGSVSVNKLPTPSIHLEQVTDEPDIPDSPDEDTDEVPFIITSTQSADIYPCFVARKAGPHTVRIYTIGAKSLPDVTTSDNDKILQVVDGEWKVLAVKDSSVKTYVDEYISSALGGDY
jgi:hypothetical protein